jgi:hypothetical protein
MSQRSGVAHGHEGSGKLARKCALGEQPAQVRHGQRVSGIGAQSDRAYQDDARIAVADQVEPGAGSVQAACVGHSSVAAVSRAVPGPSWSRQPAATAGNWSLVRSSVNPRLSRAAISRFTCSPPAAAPTARSAVPRSAAAGPAAATGTAAPRLSTACRPNPPG